MSHFSFTRNAYDKCAFDATNAENDAIFQRNTDSKVTDNSCFVSFSQFSPTPRNSVPGAIVDTESELRGQTRLLGKCVANRFDGVPPPQKTDLRLCGPQTENVLLPEYTRINKPCNIFSGMSINRFHPLCEDLQDLNKIHANNYIGSNSRLDIKDAHDRLKPAKNLIPKK